MRKPIRLLAAALAVTLMASLAIPAFASYTVEYNDGASGEVFPSQTYEGLMEGVPTPEFNSVGGLAEVDELNQPVREGFQFVGWQPEVSDTVKGDATYTATWRIRNTTQGLSPSDSSDEVPFILFINEPNNTPDLYVTKSVTASTAGLEIPDARFSFSVTVDGKLYEKKAYRVLNEAGEEIFRYINADMTVTECTKAEREAEGGNTATTNFETDANGTFSISAGQTAWFEYVGNGKVCVVKEMGSTILGEGTGEFTQIEPAGGDTWNGTVDADGIVAKFVNRYDEPEEGKEGETELTISKTISYPADYQIPVSPDFTFELKISDEFGMDQPWHDEPYTLYDSENTNHGTKYTDANGRFTLKAGERAVFEHVPTNRDYRVNELLDEPSDGGQSPKDMGWRAVGDTEARGATALNMAPISFHNAIASFAVYKRMEDYSYPEDTFTFKLTNGDGEPWADAKYYLYNTDKTPVDSDTHTTGEDGTFTLTAGQMAVFIGIEPGTAYTVSEEVPKGYEQITPAEGGYSSTVSDSQVNIHDFVNKVKEPEPELFWGILPTTGGSGTAALTVLTGAVLLGTGLMLAKKKRDGGLS